MCLEKVSVQKDESKRCVVARDDYSGKSFLFFLKKNGTPNYGKKPDNSLEKELVTQSLPYAHIDNDIAVLFAISRHELPGADSWLPSPVLDTAGTLALIKLWSLCVRCWKRSPLERPTASEIRDELRVFMWDVMDEDMVCDSR